MVIEKVELEADEIFWKMGKNSGLLWGGGPRRGAKNTGPWGMGYLTVV